MKEVKNPKKPLIFYYGVILLVVILLNLIAGPMLMQHQVKDVDYGTFLSMIADKNIGEVEIDNSEIIFTDKSNETTYKTGKMDDPQLVQRLYDSGAKFEQEIQQTTSPILSFLLTFVLPLIIFVGLGQYMGYFLCPWPVYVQEAHEQDGRRQKFHDVRYGQEQCQDLRPIHRGHSF